MKRPGAAKKKKRKKKSKKKRKVKQKEKINYRHAEDKLKLLEYCEEVILRESQGIRGYKAGRVGSWRRTTHLNLDQLTSLHVQILDYLPEIPFNMSHKFFEAGAKAGGAEIILGTGAVTSNFDFPGWFLIFHNNFYSV